MVIVADTSPLNYLILIQTAEVLPALYGRIIIPPEALTELRNIVGPPQVQEWASSPPGWLEVRAPTSIDASLPLGAGEKAAIALARELLADRLLLDDRDGREVAARLGIPVAGTLTVLRDAAVAGLIELGSALDRLKGTTFRASPKLFQQILEDFEKNKTTQQQR